MCLNLVDNFCFIKIKLQVKIKLQNFKGSTIDIQDYS